MQTPCLASACRATINVVWFSRHEPWQVYSKWKKANISISQTLICGRSSDREVNWKSIFPEATRQSIISPSSPSSLQCGDTSILVSSEQPIFSCLVFVFTLPPQFIVASRRLLDGSMMFALVPKLSKSSSTSTLSLLLLLRLFRTSLMTSSSSMLETSLPSSETSLYAPLLASAAGSAIESLFLLSDAVDCSSSSPPRSKERRCRNDLLRSLRCQLLSDSSSFLKLNDVCALKLAFGIILPSNNDKSWRWWWLLWSFELWLRLWREAVEYGGLIRPRNV